MTPAAAPGPASVDVRLPQVRGHQPALDGVRAIAALMVLVFHVAVETGDALEPGVAGALLAGGEMAVPLFFALSGLLLYRPWARAALDDVRGPSARDYLWRRAVRVLPAYWLVAVVALLLWSQDRLQSVLVWLEVMTLTFTYNTDPWWYGTGPQGLGQMWSLCVEVSFYLLLPLLAAVLARLAARGRADVDRRARWLLVGLAVLSALSLAALVLQFHPVHHPVTHMWLPRTLGLFAVGMALAVLSEWTWRERGADGPVRRFCRTLAASPGLCWGVAGAAYLFAVTPLTGPRFVGVDGFWSAVAELVLTMTFAFFFVAPVALMPERPDGGPGWLRAFLGHRIMLFLGRISYGVFLWQFVVLYLWRDFTGQEAFTGSLALDLVPVTAGTLLLATATYHWLERPLVRRYSTTRRAARRG